MILLHYVLLVLGQNLIIAPLQHNKLNNIICLSLNSIYFFLPIFGHLQRYPLLLTVYILLSLLLYLSFDSYSLFFNVFKEWCDRMIFNPFLFRINQWRKYLSSL